MHSRYRKYCAHFGIEHTELVFHPYYVEREWTSGILDVLIDRMKSGDLAAAQIGIEMMEEDRGFAFGRIVKSKIPRALAKCDLTGRHKERIRKRVVAMLLRPFLPKESGPSLSGGQNSCRRQITKSCHEAPQMKGKKPRS